MELKTKLHQTAWNHELDEELSEAYCNFIEQSQERNRISWCFFQKEYDHNTQCIYDSRDKLDKIEKREDYHNELWLINALGQTNFVFLTKYRTNQITDVIEIPGNEYSQFMTVLKNGMLQLNGLIKEEYIEDSKLQEETRTTEIDKFRDFILENNRVDHLVQVARGTNGEVDYVQEVPLHSFYEDRFYYKKVYDEGSIISIDFKQEEKSKTQNIEQKR